MTPVYWSQKVKRYMTRTKGGDDYTMLNNRSNDNDPVKPLQDLKSHTQTHDLYSTSNRTGTRTGGLETTNLIYLPVSVSRVLNNDHQSILFYGTRFKEKNLLYFNSSH